MEFIANIKSVEDLLRLGAKYKMSDQPQYGVNIVSWSSISEELKKNISLNNCRYVNTMDVFVLNGVEFNPIKLQ